MHRITHRHFVFALAFFGILFSAEIGLADTQPQWTVSSMSGDALYLTLENVRQPLRRGQILYVGDRIETGDSGKVIVTHGKQSILVAANSSFEIRATKSGFFTRIFQRFGTLMFQVDKRAVKHFEVDTPFLHAVVKGTTFTVSVDNDGAAVHVTNGLVEVTAPLADGYGAVGNQTLLVSRGYTASISGGRGSHLQMGVSSHAPGATEHGHQIRSDLGGSSLNIEKASKGLLRGYAAQNNAHGKAAASGSETARSNKRNSSNVTAQQGGLSLPPGLGGEIRGNGANGILDNLVGQNAAANAGNGKGKGKKK